MNRCRIDGNRHFHILVGHRIFMLPAEEETAEAGQRASGQITDGKLLSREEELLARLVEEPGRQYRDVWVRFHVRDHPAEQGRMEGNARVQHKMIFALQLGQDRIVRPGDTDVFILRDDNNARESPFQPLRCQFLRRIITEEDRYLKIRILNAAKSDINLVLAAIHDQTCGKNRRHGSGTSLQDNEYNPVYFTGKNALCKESQWQKTGFDDILSRRQGCRLPNQQGRGLLH